MKGTVLDTVLREFGGSLSHLWILLRLSSPGWYYGEYHYPGRELTQWQIFRQNEYPGTMISVFRSVCQPASLDRIRWIYLRNVIFGWFWIMHAMHQNQERIVTNVNLSKFRGITLGEPSEEKKRQNEWHRTSFVFPPPSWAKNDEKKTSWSRLDPPPS